MLGTDFILDAFAKEGIDHLFMVPGGLIDPFRPALGRQNLLKPIVGAQCAQHDKKVAVITGDGCIHMQGIEIATAARYQLAAAILTLTLTWEDIPASLQKLAIDTYGMEGLVEVVVLSGFYQLFSAVNQGFDIP